MKAALALIVTLFIPYMCLDLTAGHPTYLAVIAIAVMGAFIVSSLEKLIQTIERLIQTAKGTDQK